MSKSTDIEMERLSIRLNPYLKDRFHEKCVRMGLTATEVVRFFLMSWLDGGITINARLPDDLRQDTDDNEATAGGTGPGKHGKKPGADRRSDKVGKRGAEVGGRKTEPAVGDGSPDLYAE